MEFAGPPMGMSIFLESDSAVGPRQLVGLQPLFPVLRAPASLCFVVFMGVR